MEIGERRKLGHSLREKRYDRAYVLPNSFKSALVPFFAESHCTGWRGEMRYGLLNDVRVLDKEAWPLMVENVMSRWPMTKALCAQHKICRSHCYGRSCR
ncbi:glycosyltransferase family 9 protein [Escherichia coli]